MVQTGPALETETTVSDFYGQNYRKIVRKKWIVLFSLAALVLISFLVDISYGASQLPLSDVINSLMNTGRMEGKLDIIVKVIRLPIAVMAILVGCSLAIAGMEMQTILHNSLASPFTLGISSAASFGAALSLAFGYSIFPVFIQNIATPLFAFVFALGSSYLIFLVGKFRKDRATIILSGIALNFLFTALNSIVTYFVSDEVLRGITNWSQGNILGATWQKDLIVFVVVLVITPFIFKDSWKLTALCMGDDSAASLGIQVDRLRAKIMILCAVITSVAVCFVGTIGFVGLVAPYLAKTLVGEEQRFFIPASMLMGAFMLSLASVLSKMVIPGVQIPLGIVTSMIGIPFLLMLILKKEGYRGVS